VIKEKLGHRIDGWIHTLFPFLFWRPISPDLMTVVGTLIAGSSRRVNSAPGASCSLPGASSISSMASLRATLG